MKFANPETRLAFWFLMPTAVVLLGIVAYPFFFNVYVSLTNWNMYHFRNPELKGFAHYGRLLLEPDFARIFGKTIAWTVINLIFHFTLGLGAALLLNQKIPGRNIYRALLILPWAVPQYISALTWRGMFNVEFGAVNQLLGKIGIEPISWFASEGAAFSAAVITNIWLGFPFIMVIALGGLQSIPQELYEAARIDGAGPVRRFFHITLPMLKPVLLPALILGTIWTFNNLNVIWLVTDQGLPADKSHILVTYVYKAAFFYYRFGYAAAFSVFIFLVLMVIVQGYPPGSPSGGCVMAGPIRIRKARNAWTMVWVHLLVWAFVLFALFPVVQVIGISLRPGDQLYTTSLQLIPDNATFEAYRVMLTEKPFLLWLRNSVIVAVGTALIGVALASLGGFALSRARFAGRGAALQGILMTQMFPATMLLLPLYLLMRKLHLVDTLGGVMIAYVATALPFCIWTMKGYYDTIPADLNEAALIDGCNPFQAFVKVTLPLSAPALVITALFSFMTGWSEFMVARVMLASEDLMTLPLGLESLFNTYQTEWANYAAGSLLVTLPVVVLFLVLNRFLVSGLTLGSVKG